MQLFDPGTVAPDEASAEACGLELHEVLLLLMRVLRAGLRERSESGLSMAQFRVLFILRCRVGLSLGDLAERLGLTPPATSHLVSGLVDRGLVARERDAADRRRVVLSVTDRGRELLHEVRAGGQRKLAGLLADLPVEERRLVLQAVRVLRRVVDAETEERHREGPH